ncbi:Uncharacterised protein [Mycobacteroides abscessus subsp. abscessus]|nr:Uncharacterised protein [Mycobacteroides abscessus subsp. abscessus]
MDTYRATTTGESVTEGLGRYPVPWSPLLAVLIVWVNRNRSTDESANRAVGASQSSRVPLHSLVKDGICVAMDRQIVTIK